MHWAETPSLADTALQVFLEAGNPRLFLRKSGS